MAIAPTTSSSAILGQVSPGIEPYMSNFFKAGLAKGNFIRKNKYLQKLLESKGIDNEDTWRVIMRNHGSVQELSELSDEEKLVFRTFKETSQADIIDQAGDRQEYIDQSQSLNLMIPSTLPVKDVNNFVSINDTVRFKIIDFDEKTHQARLSLKAVQPNRFRKERKVQKFNSVPMMKIGFKSIEEKMEQWIKEAKEEKI